MREGPAFQERAWPVYLGAPARAAAAQDSLAADPQPVWHASAARGITGGLALSEDLVAISGTDHRAVLLDRATGQPIWDRRLGQALGAGPLIRDDRLFVAEQGAGGRVYALRLFNGQTLWSTEAGDVAAPLALDGPALYLGTIDGMVGRLSADTGSFKWRARLAGAIRSAPIPTAAGLVVATATDSLYLLDAATGAVRARRATHGTVLAAMARIDSLVVIGTTAGTLEALDPATLRTRWSLEFGEPIVGAVAIRAGNAYALTGRGLLIVVPLRDARSARRLPLDLIVRAGPAPTAAGVFVSAVNGELVLFDSAGTRRWAAQLEAPLVEPVLIDRHMLVAATRRGAVVAYR